MDDVAAASSERQSTSRSWALLGFFGVFCVVAFAVALWPRESLVTSPVATTTPVPPAPATIDGWTPYWVLDRILEQPDSGASRLSNLREVSPFWFSVTGFDAIDSDTFTPDDLAEEYIGQLRNAGVAVVPSLLDRMDAGQMATILSNPVVRSAHVVAIREFAEQLDADGIDIDYEQFAFADDPSTWIATRPNWIDFIAELSVGLHDDGRTLSVSIPAVYDERVTGDRGYWVYDHGAIAEYVDSLRIMAYDYSVVEPGPIAPLDWFEQVIDGVLLAVPQQFHERIVLGIGSYGYNWPTTVIGECPEDAPGRTGVNPGTLDDLISRRGIEPVADVVTGEWTATYELTVDNGVTQCVQTRQLHWIDADGVALRVEMARRAGIEGVALWALGYEDDEVWNALISSSTRNLIP
jgi:spore germination protein YaaH